MMEGSNLTRLGGATTYRYDEPSKDILECFENKANHRDYVVEYSTQEFTSLCPKTGQPDFAGVSISYIPDKLCVETKSLKLYLGSYRNTGSFMETITNRILDDLVLKCHPRRMKVVAEFAPRGGIAIKVEAVYDIEETGEVID